MSPSTRPICLAILCACGSLESCAGNKADTAPESARDSNLPTDDSASSPDSGDSPTDLDGDGYSSSTGDCDDGDANVYPDATETCNGRDDDCDSLTDADDDSLDTWAWLDEDLDGYAGTFAPTCVGGESEGTDCDDTDPSINPGIEDASCDGIDSDCDSSTASGVAFVESVYYDSVQSAIDAAPEGATVLICAGTHSERLYIGPSRRLELASYSGDATDTILDGDASWTILYIDEEAMVGLTSLTFANGAAEDWGFGAMTGGAVASLKSSVTISDCTFSGNTSSYAAGAVMSVNDANGSGGYASLTIRDSTFIDNSSGYEGGAVQIDGYYGHTDALIESTAFIENQSQHGAALLIGMSGTADVLIQGSTFTSNEAWRVGASINISSWATEVTLTVEDSTFTENVVEYYGAAIDVASTVGDVFITLRDSAITSNVSLDSYPAGVNMHSKTTLVSDNVDWGTGSMDNDMGDLHTGPDGGSYYDTLGAGETFTCVGSGACVW